MSPLDLIRRVAPKRLVRAYHRLLAWSAMWWYGRASRQMTVIGVTGTDGKTTTATLIADLLQAAGHKVGLCSSVWYQIADKRWLNESHMTMPGRFALQRMLRQMVKAGCQYAVLEVSSEGIQQGRHTGIDFNCAVLTNLTPEHIEAHGSFERYRYTKGRLFERLIKSGDKLLNGQHAKRISVVNVDDPSADYFLKFWAEEHHGTSLKTAPELPAGLHTPVTVWQAEDISISPQLSTFSVQGHQFTLSLPGRYNVANALQAIVVARSFDVDWSVIVSALPASKAIPGRGETIEATNGTRVVVDYALTPASLRQFYQSLRDQGAQRIIAVFGAAGGGRDTWKRPELGKIAAEFADQIILTTDDPYNESPAAIADAIAAGVPAASRQKVEIVLDRRAAISQGIATAQPGDVVAITGMGAETSMMVKGKKVPWSDSNIVRELLGQ